jgi:hypothetical protein
MDSYIGNRPLSQCAGYRTEFIATAGQTQFNVSYAVGYVDVFQNGVKLGKDDFTANDSATVSLARGAAAGDLVAFIAWAKGTMVPTEDFYTKTDADDRFVNANGDTMTGQLTISGANFAVTSGLSSITRPTGIVLQLTNQNTANDTLINATSGANQTFVLTRDALVKYAYANTAGNIGMWPGYGVNSYLTVADGTYNIAIGTRGGSGVPYLAATGGPLELRSTSSIKFPTGVASTTLAANAHLAAAEGNRFYISSSSAKHKTNVRTLSPYDKIDQLNPVTFTSLCEADGGKELMGFVVEELAAVDPRLADVEAEYYDYRALIAILVAEVQSLRTRVAALEAA